MADLDKALQLMLKAHAGQKDKGGEPYVLHPLRLMFRLEGPEERMVALLHDVVEDSALTLDSLRREGFSAAVVDAVDCLTRRKGESYEVFIQRVAANPLAVKVKVADLSDNLDLRRLKQVGDADLQRLRKYHHALGVLQKLD